MITGSFSLVGIQDAILVESCYKATQQNIAPSAPTSNNEDGSIPEGWSGTLISVSASMPYVWESQRTKDGNWSVWSTPILKNSWGKQGAKMRMRTWSSDTEYLSGADGEEFYDVVVYNDKLYLCTKTHTSGPDNNPSASISGYLGYWESAQEWTFVATELLLTKTIKANQIDADGLVAKDVNITGKIYAEEGELGKMTIKADTADDGLYLKDDTYGSEMSLKSRMFMSIPYNVFAANPGSDQSNVLLYVKKRRGNSFDRVLYVDGVAEVYGRLGVGKGKNTGFNQFYPALVAEGISCYGQFCLPIKTVTSTSSLDSTSSYVVLNFSSSGGYIRLPSTNLTDGQTIIIRNIGSNNVTVYGNMKNESNGSITQYTFSTGGRLHVHTYYQNGNYWLVNNLN